MTRRARLIVGWLLMLAAVVLVLTRSTRVDGATVTAFWLILAGVILVESVGNRRGH